MAYNSRFMSRAIAIAEKARGKCSPNPFVGAVIVKNGLIVAEGWTQSYGDAHAEVHALRKAGAEARGAEIYVTLEPCSHYGKTPPCAEALIKAGIKTVYVGIVDPNPLVSGAGITMLEEAGIEVQAGFMQTEISKQLEFFLCRINKNRPFIAWKTALSLDGKFAAVDGSSRWITGPKARYHVHKLRSYYDVILTGIGTVKADDPMLNNRVDKTRGQPCRVVLDPQLEIDPACKICTTAKEQRSIVYYRSGLKDKAKLKALDALAVITVAVNGKEDELDLYAVVKDLQARGFYSVLLEAGSILSSAFFTAKLVDKCYIFIGNKILGSGKPMLKELDIPNIDSALILVNRKVRALGDDIMIEGYFSG